MLYDLTRIFLFIIIFSLTFWLFRKHKYARSKWFLVFVFIFSLGCGSLIEILPLENFFFTFKSPESVFAYTKNGEIIDITCGKSSCFIFYKTVQGPTSFYLVPKSKDGYGIPSSISLKNVSQKFVRDYIFDVYQFLGTNDYYVFGSTIAKSVQNEIVDSNGNAAKYFVFDMGNSEQKSIAIYAYVENFTNDYFLIVNGEKIKVAD